MRKRNHFVLALGIAVMAFLTTACETKIPIEGGRGHFGIGFSCFGTDLNVLYKDIESSIPRNSGVAQIGLVQNRQLCEGWRKVERLIP